MFRSAFGDDFAPVYAGAGADVYHIVGTENGVFIVFDDDHRVADVAKLLECLQQAGVVALVQAD